MRTHLLVIISTVLVLPAGWLPPASATPVVPPERPRERQVELSFFGGDRLRGTLLELSPAAVTLLVDGTRREYPLSRVDTIQSEADSLRNGALIGAAIVGGYCLLVCGQGLDHGDALLPAVLVNAGIGALIGIAIDGASSNRTVLYRAAGPPPGRSLAVRPSVSFRVRF